MRDAFDAIDVAHQDAKARIADGAEAVPSRLTIFHYAASVDLDPAPTPPSAE